VRREANFCHGLRAGQLGAEPQYQVCDAQGITLEAQGTTPLQRQVNGFLAAKMSESKGINRKSKKFLLTLTREVLPSKGD